MSRIYSLRPADLRDMTLDQTIDLLEDMQALVEGSE